MEHNNQHPTSTALGECDHDIDSKKASKLTKFVQKHFNAASPSNRPADTAVDSHLPFSFPTLNIDGSLPDISQGRLGPGHKTPPAALSSLAAKMAEQNMNSSTNSLADDQYDMVDDASEASIDDRETVSLASTERRGSDASDDGQMTPDETGSMIDMDEPHGDEEVEDQITIERQLYTPVESQVLESVLSEDLETPRQSSIGGKLSGLPTPRPSAPPEEAKATSANVPTRQLRILFIGKREVNEAAKLAICGQIAASLVGHEYKIAEPTYRIAKLPPTPDGIEPSSATMLEDGHIQLYIKYCVDAVAREQPEVYGLQILDLDGEHSSMCTIGRGGKVETEAPDLAVLYQPFVQPVVEQHPRWFTTAKNAMSRAGVPLLQMVGVMDGSYYRLAGSLTRDALTRDNFALQFEDFYGMDDDVRCAGLEEAMRLESRLPEDPREPRHKKREHATTTPSPWHQRAGYGLRKLSDECGFTNYYNRLAQRLSQRRSLLRLVLALLPLLPIILLSMYFQPGPSPMAALAGRREHLASALVKLTNSTEATKTFNIEHLLPSPTALVTTFGGREYLTVDTVQYQGVAPNHVVVSLPRGKYPYYPTAQTVTVLKNGHPVDYNTTKLISGVYDVIFDKTAAYGNIDVNMYTTHPAMNITVSHNFGRRILQRNTYEKASTDLSRAVNMDIAVAQKAAKGLSQRMLLEFDASVAATKNITKQMAVYASRDLQVLANTAASVSKKAVNASSVMADMVRTDLVLLQQDLIKLSTEVKDLMTWTKESAKSMVPNKKTFTDPLLLSRERALQLFSRKKDVKSKCSGKCSCKRCSLSTVPESSLTKQWFDKTAKTPSARDPKARADMKSEKALKKADRDLKKWAKRSKSAEAKKQKNEKNILVVQDKKEPKKPGTKTLVIPKR